MKVLADLVHDIETEPAIRAAIERVGQCRQTIADAGTRRARAEAELKAADTVEEHRRAKAALAALDDAAAEAAIELRLAEKALPRLRTETHDAAKAIVRREYAARLPRFEEAFNVFAKAVAELAEVERVAARYDLASGSSIGPGRRCLADVPLALPILERMRQWRTWLAARTAA